MISLLTKLPFLASVFSAVKKRPRLLIEYGLIIGVVALAATTFTLWLKNDHIEEKLQVTEQSLNNLRFNIASLELVNQEQSEQIQLLEGARVRDSEALENLVEDLETISKREKNFREKLNSLEKENEDIQDFLSTPVPYRLRRLPDDSGTKDANQNRK